jgi:uncharacterized membrane protein
MDETKPTNSNASKFTNLEPHIASAIAYAIPPFTGIAFFLIEKEDKTVRFHAFQSILFGLLGIVLSMLTSNLYLPGLGYALYSLISLGMFIVYLMLIWKAYNKEMFELPVLGKIAKTQTSK